jgi:hypothetical protein
MGLHQIEKLLHRKKKKKLNKITITSVKQTAYGMGETSASYSLDRDKQAKYIKN